MLASQSVELQARGYRLLLKHGQILQSTSDMDKVWLVRRLFSMGWVQHQNRDFFLNNPIEPRFFPKLGKEEWEYAWPKILKERAEQNLFELLCQAEDWTWRSLTKDQEGMEISLMDQDLLEQLAPYWQKKDLYTVRCSHEQQLPQWLAFLSEGPLFLDEILLFAPFEGCGTILELLDLEEKEVVQISMQQADKTSMDLFFSEEEDQIVLESFELHEAFIEMGSLYQEVYDFLEERDLQPQEWILKILKGLQSGSDRLRDASFEQTPSTWIASLVGACSDEKLLLKDLSRLFTRMLKSRILGSKRVLLNSKHQAWKHQWKL